MEIGGNIRFSASQWAKTATVVVGVVFGAVAVVALVAREFATALVAIGILATSVVSIWTIYYLRQDFEASHRPYLAITENEVADQNPAGFLTIRLGLTNSGASPGAITEERKTVTRNGETEIRSLGDTKSDIVYPKGETIWVGFGEPIRLGSSVAYEISYTDLDRSHNYRFAIEYKISETEPPAVGIVRKEAT